MSRKRLQIIILEHSQIIFEGVHAVLSQSDLECNIGRAESLEELENILPSKETNTLIINPLQLANREREIKRIKKNHPNLSIVGIQSGVIDNQLQSLLDHSFTIFDTEEEIISILRQSNRSCSIFKDTEEDDNLTDREIDVLTKLAHGFSNKEIADMLSISIHTVVTHRKNITLKTGIRSQSGLAIYAISKNIVSIKDFS